MGCCFSTPKQNPDDQNGLKHQKPHLRTPLPKSNATHEVHRIAPPPPPPVEEESVKEVLSETPISKPQVPTLTVERKTQMPNIQYQAEKFETKGPFNKAEEVSEVSQLSEICSMSGSFSTTTTATVTDNREDEATSKRSIREGTQKWNAPRKRPCTVDGKSTGGRERRPKSPATRPEKKNQASSRAAHGREWESAQVGTWKLNAGSPSAVVRRDHGEGSGRRSRSPSSARMVGAGSGRNQLKPSGGACRRFPPAKCVEESDGVPREESLENPLVSLECFIFL